MTRDPNPQVRIMVETIADIGQIGFALAKIFGLLLLFALTAKSMDETMGDWHIRLFGKPLFSRKTLNSRNSRGGIGTSTENKNQLFGG